MSASLFQDLVNGVLSTIEPFVDAAEDPGLLAKLLDALGADDPRLVDSHLATGLGALAQAIQDVQAVLAAPDVSLESAQTALDGLRSLMSAVQALSASGGSMYPALGADLVNLALTNGLRNASPLLFQIAVGLGLVNRQALPALSVSGQLVRLEQPVDRIVLNKVGTLLNDPLALIRSDLPSPLLSTVANAQQTADTIVNQLGPVLNALGVPWSYGYEPGDEQYLGDAVATAARTLTVFVPFGLAGGAVAGVSILLSSADTDDLGVVLTPFGALTLQGTAGPFQITVQLLADVGAVAFGGGKGVQILASTSASEVQASVTAAPAASTASSAGGPAFIFGSSTGSRLELGKPQLSAHLNAASARVDFELTADTGASALVIAPGDGDSFLADVLPAGGLRAAFDLGLGWGNNSGLTFKGSGGLDTSTTVGLALGPLTLSALHLALRAQAEGGIQSEVSADVSVTLGPVHASIERVGLTSTLSFPASGGSLGVADLDLAFKAPAGIGVSIDAQGVVTGGGFLQYDPARHQYGGALQLTLQSQLTLTAVGLLTTTLPDGSPGYSLLVFITADGFQPIPLGFGFQLVAIGGLVGVNRTFDQAALTAGLKTDTLGQILFPRDPVGNAPALLAALGTVFPAQKGSYLLGLMARITWFTPTLVELDLALVLQLGAATELLALGRVSSVLPSQDNDLLRLTMDAIGVLNFDAGTFSAEALLVDSRVAHQFPITGGAALQAQWGSGGQSGSGANFILAVGGVNPRYTPPPGFPDLPRVAIALCAGSNPRLICQAYFALTANTIQFGAQASLYAEAAGFRVTGDVGFDVLVQPLPFQFVADFHASVQLKWKSYNLAKVALSGSLAGPIPLRLTAKATIEILWFSVSMSLDLTLNPTAALQGPAVSAVELDSLVGSALGTAANWRTIAAGSYGVSLRPAGPGLTLDPLGQLAVEQSVAPLNMSRPVTNYGGAPVAGATQFTLAGALGDVAGTPVNGAFAPSRYFTLTVDEKLSAPSFEALDAGMILGASAFSGGSGVSAPLTYRALTLNAVAAAQPAPAQITYSLPVPSFTAQRPTGSAARAPNQRVGRRRFANSAASPAATLTAPDWRLVHVADGTVATPVAGRTGWSETNGELATLNRGGAAWQMVPAHELAAN